MTKKQIISKITEYKNAILKTNCRTEKRQLRQLINKYERMLLELNNK